jgi:hypothetical protein
VRGIMESYQSLVYLWTRGAMRLILHIDHWSILIAPPGTEFPTPLKQISVAMPQKDNQKSKSLIYISRVLWRPMPTESILLIGKHPNHAS